MIGSRTHQIVYVRIPKTGSSSVKFWMKPNLPGTRTILGGEQHTPWVPPEFKDCDVFVTIREPLARAASLWSWCRSIYPGMADWSFERFFDLLIGYPADIDSEEGYRLSTTPPCSQMWFIDQSRAVYRHRMEELDTLPASWRFRKFEMPPMEHRSHGSNYTPPEWTPENKARVEKLWPRDFEELGY